MQAASYINVMKLTSAQVPFVLHSDIYIKVKAAIEASKTKMFLFVLCLSISSLYSYPASSIDQSDPPCDTLKSFEQSLEEARHSVPYVWTLRSKLNVQLQAWNC